MKNKNPWAWICLCAALLHGGPAAADEQTLGDVATALLVVGTIGSTYYYDDSVGRKMLWKSTAVSYGANGLLRVALSDTELGRRPNGKGYGFPSGHAGITAAGASFLQERYGWKWGVPAYLATTYVSYVRVVNTGHHRWRDVIAAYALAQGVAWWLVNPLEEEGEETQLSIAPMVDYGTVGAQLRFSW